MKLRHIVASYVIYFTNTHLENCSGNLCKSLLCIQSKIMMDTLIIYNSPTNGSDISYFVAEPFRGTSQLFYYILQLSLLVVILVVTSLYLRTNTWSSSLVDYGGKQMANTPQSSKTWDEKAIEITLQELGQKREDMVLMPDLFVSWAAEPPRINPHYQKVKNEAEEWFKK